MLGNVKTDAGMLGHVLAPHGSCQGTRQEAEGRALHGAGASGDKSTGADTQATVLRARLPAPATIDYRSASRRVAEGCAVHGSPNPLNVLFALPTKTGILA